MNLASDVADGVGDFSSMPAPSRRQLRGALKNSSIASAGSHSETLTPSMDIRIKLSVVASRSDDLASVLTRLSLLKKRSRVTVVRGEMRKMMMRFRT